MAEFITRLIMKVDVDHPSEAAPAFVDALVLNGLVDWWFRVETLEGQVVGYYNGVGAELDPADLPKIAEATAAEQSDAALGQHYYDTVTAPRELSPEDEQKLTDLAARLNVEDEPNAP